MPPAATVKADVLKDSGAGYQVNASLRPKAALAFLAALKVLSVFLSHKRSEDSYQGDGLSISFSLQPCAMHDNLGVPLESGARTVSSSHVTPDLMI